MSGRAIVNGKRERHATVARVHEQGRRVHGWQLTHDVLVNCLGDFRRYWSKAQEQTRAQA